MLFLFADRLLGDRVSAFAAAAVFALHPAHVEAVAWISAMTDLEATFFCLVAGWACATLWESSVNWNGVVRMLVVAAAFLVAALCVLRINLRVLDWQDDITLFTHSLAAQPNDFRLHDALGAAYWI
jgi:SNF family Na+-dependent transporter